jgi:SAM-dependent methyltransferase
MPSCPLCESAPAPELCRDRRRRYFQCAACALIFADPAARPTHAEERAVYDLHQNNPADPDYRRFLNRLAKPLTRRLAKKGLRGLDFGSGPGPTLSAMLEETGYKMSIYDPLYAPDASVLERRYDFVTCTEAIEHFHTPAREWRRLLGLVKPGGWLGIMTRLVPQRGDFADWYYKNDPTHVSFFSRETFRHLARRDCLNCEFVGEDVILFRLGGGVA